MTETQPPEMVIIPRKLLEFYINNPAWQPVINDAEAELSWQHAKLELDKAIRKSDETQAQMKKMFLTHPTKKD